MVGPWMLGDQYAVDHGRNWLGQDAQTLNESDGRRHGWTRDENSKRIRPWASSWFVHGRIELKVD